MVDGDPFVHATGLRMRVEIYISLLHKKLMCVASEF